MITAAGVGSGIDIESILTQLMEIEQQPITKLNERRERLDVELSAFGTVKSSLNELATSARTLGDQNSFGPFVASTSDEAVLTATATGGGVAESHAIEVSALAQNNRLATKAYASAEETVARGTWSFGSGENQFDITIAAPDNSLLDLRNTINDSADNTSIVASILNVDGGSRLVLTAKESGTDNAISLGGKASKGKQFSEITPAADAQLTVDGFAVTSATNSIADVIGGVTLDLKSIGKAQMNTSRDIDSLKASLDEFVTRYNDLRSNLTQLSESELQGDRLPRNIESRLRESFSSPIALANGTTMSPLSLGFTFDRYGTLSIDDARLADAQKGGLESFINAFAERDNGMANRLETLLEPFTRAGGVIDSREDGIDSRRQVIDDRIERLDYRLAQTEERLRRQFTIMDRVVTDLQSTSSFLVSRLGGA